MKKRIWLPMIGFIFVAALIVVFILTSSDPVAKPTISVYIGDGTSFSDISGTFATAYVPDLQESSDRPFSESDAGFTTETSIVTQVFSEPETTTRSTDSTTRTASSVLQTATSKASSSATTKKTSVSTPVRNEMRAIWVPYMTLNKVTKSKIDTIVATAKKHGYNAIMLHVRPFCDAMYKSAYFPTSHIVAGTQGEKLPFDVLEYTIKKAHAENIQVHAWLNPLRIQLRGTTPKTLSADNPYNIYRNDAVSSNDSWVVDHKGSKYLNPGVPEIRKLIVNGIREIVRNYDVDGIHWDDYFYPASDESFDDSREYNAYKKNGGKKSLSDWRKDNINTLVRDSYSAVKSEKKNVVFGISPAGNPGNCRNAGADIDTWGSKSGYVDYICPQIYWSFKHSSAAFDKMCQKWKKIVTNKNVKLYIGLALYKAGSDDDKGTWQGDDNVLAREVEYARGNGINAQGFMVYSYDYLSKSQTKKEVANLDKMFS